MAERLFDVAQKADSSQDPLWRCLAWRALEPQGADKGQVGSLRFLVDWADVETRILLGRAVDRVNVDDGHLHVQHLVDTYC